MTCSQTEIERAEQMKEQGLEWNPTAGDIVLCKYNDWEWILIVLEEKENNQLLCYQPTPEKPAKEFAILRKERVTWLPLWHQCIALLRQRNIRCIVEVLQEATYIEYFNTELPFLGQTCGDTDLEAIYQGMLLYVLKGNNEK